jgi:hypothetical protein
VEGTTGAPAAAADGTAAPGPARPTRRDARGRHPRWRAVAPAEATAATADGVNDTEIVLTQVTHMR